MPGRRVAASLCLALGLQLALGLPSPSTAAVPDTLYAMIFEFFEDNEKLVIVDPATGALTPPGGGIADCCFVSSGVSTLDPNGDRFFFIGHSLTISGDPDRIYSVDLDTGNVLANPSLTEGVAGINYNFVEYDLSSDTLFAMIFDFDADKEKLVSIDPATGALTDVGAGIADCCLVSSGVSTLDPNGGRFFFIGQSLTIPTDPRRIYSVDLDTGNVLANPALPEGASGINYNFLEFDPLIVPPNEPPVALCQDVTVDADALCQADASIDDGSFDPEGGPVTLSQDPPPPYPLGDTLVELTVEDQEGATDSCEAVVTVVDATAPQIECNAPATITPPDAPISFTASATDNCSDPTVVVTGFDCFKFTKKGKRIDKTESCVVQLDGATVTVVDSGGVGNNITWEVEATDGAGNVATAICQTQVVRPGKASSLRKAKRKAAAKRRARLRRLRRAARTLGG